MPIVRINEKGEKLSEPQKKIRMFSLVSSGVCLFCSAFALLGGMTVEAAYFAGLAASITSGANLIIAPL